MAELKTIPEIRLVGFDDAWEQRKLGKVTKSYSGGTPAVGKSEYYNGCIPFIRSAEINSNTTELFLSERGLNSSSAKLVYTGDILYALYGATSGEVGIAQIKGAINQAILAIKPDDGYDSQFLMQWLCGQKQSIIGKYLQGGQGNLSAALVKDLQVAFPDYTEQKIIGTFFTNLDNLVTLHQLEHDKTVSIKKAMLEKMFPKDGADRPEVRFAGFTGAWEQRKLSELVTPIVRDIPKPTQPYSKVSVRSHAKGTFHQRIKNPDTVAMDKLFVVRENDLIVNITFAWEHAIAVATKNDDGLLVSHRFPTYIMSHSDVGFMKYVVSQENFRKKMELISPGGAGRNRVLDKKAFLNIEVMAPSDIDEQYNIGNVFIELDNLITLHQRELLKLQNIKKALLAKMFV